MSENKVWLNPVSALNPRYTLDFVARGIDTNIDEAQCFYPACMTVLCRGQKNEYRNRCVAALSCSNFLVHN